MASFPVLLFLAAVLLPFFTAHGEDIDLDDLSVTQEKVQQEIVNKHNELRRSVSPPAGNMLKMSWDIKAAAQAQEWASKCHYRHSRTQDREVDKTSCGENLFMTSKPTLWSHAIQSWFDEKDDFAYGVGPKYEDAMVGHYTQVAWYSSFKVGCGMAYCPNEETLKYYYVCHYCPAGNIVNRKYTPYLQGKPCASCPDHCDNGLCTNSCEYQDVYSNCKDLKNQVGCENDLVKGSCKASCNCSNKIY